MVKHDLFAVMNGNPTEGFTVFGPYTEAEAQYCVDVFTAWETEDTERDERATCWIVPLARGPRQDDD